MDEAFDMLKDFGTNQNQIGNKIKIFRSKNGGEYISNEFIYFCKKEGINKETSVPYNLEQNGVDERKNKSIVEAT